MWKVVLDFVGVAAVAVSVGVFVSVFYFCVVCAKNYIKRLEQEKRANCSHKNYRYTESHPEKVWTCNECGEIF